MIDSLSSTIENQLGWMHCRVEDAVISQALSTFESEDFRFGHSLSTVNPRGLNHILAGKNYTFIR